MNFIINMGFWILKVSISMLVTFFLWNDSLVVWKIFKGEVVLQYIVTTIERFFWRLFHKLEFKNLKLEKHLCLPMRHTQNKCQSLQALNILKWFLSTTVEKTWSFKFCQRVHVENEGVAWTKAKAIVSRWLRMKAIRLMDVEEG